MNTTPSQQCELVQISNESAVLFSYTSHADMVGETVQTVKAYLYQIDNGLPVQVTGSLEYHYLKPLYRKLRGKSLRKTFWSHMKEMKPAAVQQRMNDTMAELNWRIR
jgi:hypothetical protein